MEEVCAMRDIVSEEDAGAVARERLLKDRREMRSDVARMIAILYEFL